MRFSSEAHDREAFGLRFFTVYGPRGCPDMSPFIFVRAILEGKAIRVFNNGDMRRDFTYIDDIVDGIVFVRACPIAARERPTYSMTLAIIVLNC